MEEFCTVITARTFKRFIRLAAVAALAFLLAACAAQTTQPAEQGAAKPAHSWEPWDGDGMEIPLDGSSLEAFETSLARVKAHTSPEDYTTLVNAIDYLLFYDLSAGRDRTRLASILDGLTPNAIIEKVEGQRGSAEDSPSGQRAPGAVRDL